MREGVIATVVRAIREGSVIKKKTHLRLGRVVERASQGMQTRVRAGRRGDVGAEHAYGRERYERRRFRGQSTRTAPGRAVHEHGEVVGGVKVEGRMARSGSGSVAGSGVATRGVPRAPRVAQHRSHEK
jgi:hypothetical protein